MIEAIMQGFSLVFAWPTFGFLLIGIAVGTCIGVIPGLGGGIGMVLLLPFSFGLDMASALALLIGMYAVTCTGDTVTSVMLGVPGTAASQATILDGYPLAQKGEAHRALGAAFACSAFGGIFGAIILALSLPIIKPIINAFQNPELFMLALLGISMVGSLSGTTPWRGLSAACLGILIATIGYSEAGAVPRFYLGFDYLLEKAPLVPVVLGLFAIPEMIDLTTYNTSIARDASGSRKNEFSLMLRGVKDAIQHKWLALRCAAIGTYIGFLPGLGGSIVDWVAYGHAVQTSKKNPQFGKGDIRGVIAPESANNAMRGGGLIPTVVFGIPGSTGYAILLGALLVHGLKPGPSMLNADLPLTLSMVWILITSNLIAAFFMFFFSSQIAKLAFLPGRLMVPGVMIFIFMGAWMSTATLGDWVTLTVASVIGYTMKKTNWPRPPIILAFILGRLMENSFLINIRAYDGYNWLGRPIVIIILVFLALTVFFSFRDTTKNMKMKAKEFGKKPSDDTDSGKTAKKEPFLLTFGFGSFLTLLFLAAFITSFNWGYAVRLFPQIATFLGFFLSLMATIDVWRNRNTYESLLLTQDEKFSLLGAATYLVYMIAVILGVLVLGQKIMIPIFVFALLRLWGKYSVKTSLIYAFCSWSVLVILYDRILHVFWHQSILAEWMIEIFGKQWPYWLVV